MTLPKSSIFVGVTLAVISTLGWALNFITPYVSGEYTLYDLMVVRFLIAGALGVLGVILCRAHLRFLRPGQLCLAAALGALGCLGYGACIAAGVMFGGPVLTPTLVGMVPVLLALLGNARDKTVQWRRLAMPLTCLTVGLLLANLSSLHQPSLSLASWGLGLLFSLSAVGLWIGFSVINQKQLMHLPASSIGLWSALMLLGAGTATLGLLPLIQSFGLLKLPTLGLGLSRAGPLYAWSLIIALMSTVVGAWAWNAATQRLPMVLSGQLIALESLFATLLGLGFHGRWPMPMETAGLAAVLTGVVMAVRIILTRADPASTRGGAERV
ncbi:DMT family transporter [Pseudomonas sivasensis]|uniref:DMT family transporter n=1 Tax=Pseudomonas sivasensis TaxID=1880678 RepID=UPI0021A9F1B1|nr:DMT family transporter [Pseudomonas sivasensis]MCT4501713.1 DMT family transporter [Pseudomonas sivasensis]